MFPRITGCSIYVRSWQFLSPHNQQSTPAVSQPLRISLLERLQLPSNGLCFLTPPIRAITVASDPGETGSLAGADHLSG